MIRVVLADDQYLFREGIQRLLESVSDVEVAAVCNDLDSLLEAVDAKRPDVVVTDIRMPPGNADEGIQAAERLRETHPDVGVVVLSQYANPSYALALLEVLAPDSARPDLSRVEDRVEALGGRLTTEPGRVPECCRPSRSRPGRGSRPSRACGPTAPTSARA